MAKIDTLRNQNNEIIYPKTVQKAIYDNRGINLDRKVNSGIYNQIISEDTGTENVVLDNILYNINGEVIYPKTVVENVEGIGESVKILSYSKTGIIHNLSGLNKDSGVVIAIFTATDNYNIGDTFKIDDIEYTIQLSNGELPSDNLFISGATVFITINIDTKKINFRANMGNVGYQKGDVIAAENLEEAYSDGNDWDYSDTPTLTFSSGLGSGNAGQHFSPFSFDGELVGISGYMSETLGGAYNSNGEKIIDIFTFSSQVPSTSRVEQVCCDKDGNWYSSKEWVNKDFLAFGVAKTSKTGEIVWSNYKEYAGFVGSAGTGGQTIGIHIDESTGNAIGVFWEAAGGYKLYFVPINLETGEFGEYKTIDCPEIAPSFRAACFYKKNNQLWFLFGDSFINPTILITSITGDLISQSTIEGLGQGYSIFSYEDYVYILGGSGSSMRTVSEDGTLSQEISRSSTMWGSYSTHYTPNRNGIIVDWLGGVYSLPNREFIAESTNSTIRNSIIPLGRYSEKGFFSCEYTKTGLYRVKQIFDGYRVLEVSKTN